MRMTSVKKRCALVVASAALIVPVIGVSSASADRQNGLVNVYAKNIANNNQITLLQNVSISAAAAFCNVNVNVLSFQLQNNQFAKCPARTTTLQRAWVAYSPHRR